MSPMFHHQLFPARRRLEVTFRDETPNIYLVDFLGEQWIDTALLPQESDLHKVVSSVHYSLLTSHLDKIGISLERAASSPFAAKLGLFTYTAKWRLRTEEASKSTVADITISCGKVRSHRLESPEVASFRYLDRIAAEENMLVWCAEQACRSA